MNSLGRRGVPDIKSRRESRRERARDELLARFDAVLDGIPDSVVVLGADGVISFASRSVRHLLGIRPDRLVGTSGLDLVHPDDLGSALEWLGVAASATALDGPPIVRTIRLRHRAGHHVPTDIVGRPSRSSAIHSGVVLVVRDARERIAAETAARASESRYAAIVDTAPDAIVTMDTRGRITAFNPAAERIFGYSAEEAIGADIAILMPPEESSVAHATRVEQYLATGARVMLRRSRELLARRCDGEVFPIWIGVGEARLDDGERIFTAIIRDMSDRRAYEERLEFLARKDPLTCLANRSTLVERIGSAQRRARRHAGLVALLYLDLDRFKVVNDSLGHAAGDELLIEAAARINDCVRATDTVARLGGDEFVVLCEEVTTVADVAKLADRISASLAEPFRLNIDAFVTASIGVAFWHGAPEDPETLLRHADTAMYRAKRESRGSIRIYDHAMEAWVEARLAFESALRRAAERNELVLRYQPIIEVATGRIRGVEALVRWDRPGIGLVAPNDFISIAEETGAILEIGEWVLREACRAAASWRAEGYDLDVAVNLSGRQLDDGAILGVVDRALADAGLPSDALTLEVTESLLLRDLDSIVERLGGLRERGVGLALDDFGTGFSSLTYLRRLPVTKVKVDRSFVESLGSDHDDTTIVAAVVALARALGLNVVAEGVSRPEHLAALVNLGCEFAQGYWFAEPLVESELLQRFREQLEQYRDSRGFASAPGA